MRDYRPGRPADIQRTPTTQGERGSRPEGRVTKPPARRKRLQRNRRKCHGPGTAPNPHSVAPNGPTETAPSFGPTCRRENGVIVAKGMSAGSNSTGVHAGPQLSSKPLINRSYLSISFHQHHPRPTPLNSSV